MSAGSPARMRTLASLCSVAVFAVSVQVSAQIATSDPRLRRPVTAELYGEKLPEFTTALAEETKAGHRVAGQPASERSIAILNTNHSLGLVHNTVADCFNLTWSAAATPNGAFVLQESSANRKARESARNNAAKRAAKTMQERWAEAGQTAALSRETRQTLAERGDGFAQTLRDPRVEAGVRLFHSLPQSIQNRLWSEGQVRVPVSSLPANLQALTRATLPSTVMEINGKRITADGEMSATWIGMKIGGTPDRPTV